MVLIQPTKCSKEIPLNIEILNIKEHPWHMHDTLEVVYVLKGSLECGISIYPSVMNQGDIAVVNTETLHHYKGSEDNAVLICHISLDHFSDIIPEIENTLIICNSGAAVEYDKHYDILKELLANIFLFYFDLKTPHQNDLMDSCVSFLSALYNHFNFLAHDGAAIHSENIMKQRPLQAERVKRVMKYMYDNLGSKLSLEEIAAQEYVSKYYLSHLTSEFLKMPFREYLSMTRAVYAQDHLYGTDKPLSEVAASCGFSSTEAFRKAYLKYVGVSPAEDRKRIAGHTIKDLPLSDSDALSTIPLDEIAMLMGIKSYHSADVNTMPDTDYSVTSVPIDFSELTTEAVKYFTDTVWLSEPHQLLSFHTLEALENLHYYKMFSKLFVDSDTLTQLYSTFGSWDFCGSFLRSLKEMGFSLITDTCIDSLFDFSEQINGPEIQISQNADCPAIYKDTSERTHLFDEKNHKTKEFFLYYFLSKMLPNVLYTDDCCCLTYSDDKLSILLYSKPDAGIRKYMFNMKHLSRNYICRTHKISKHYQSEIDIYKELSIETSTDEELAKVIGIKALPDVELSTISGLSEYNLFLSLPPDTVMLIELT